MNRAFVLAFISFLGAGPCLLTRGSAPNNWLLDAVGGDVMGATPIRWEDCLKQAPEWYRSVDAARIADNVLLYQRQVGGWPKNIDMAAMLTEANKTNIARQKLENDATIDNGGTFTQLIFLAKVYAAQKQQSYQDAVLKGTDYLLKAQYENGGFPQYFPLRQGYYSHITFNDGAMIGVLNLLRDIARRKSLYAFVDEERRGLAEKAVQKGIECILKTQVRVQGRLTVWCAQHHEVTFAPAAARKFEPISLSGYESVGIVQFLMGIDQPNAQVNEAVESAVAWFERAKITGSSWARKRDPSKSGSFDRVVVADLNAGLLWARFYEIGTNRPIFAGRDGIIKYDVAEIEDERRNGYEWYVKAPAKLLNKDYPAWKKQVARKVN